MLISTMSKTPIIAVLLFALSIFLMGWFFTDIFSYVLVSMVIATLLRPIIELLEKRLYFPRILSVSSSILILLGIVTLLIFQFVPLISEQIKIISSLDIDRMLHVVRIPLDYLEGFAAENNIVELNDENIQESLKGYLLDLIGAINIKQIFNSIISLTGSLFVSLLGVTFITVIFASQPSMLKNNLLKLIPNNYFEIAIATFNKIEFLLGRYFRGIMLQMISIFLVSSIGLSIAGVKYAITIALFASVMNLIPYVGPLFGAIFGIIIGLTTSNSEIGSTDFYWLMGEIGIVFGIVQITDNVLLQPIIFSKSLKAHPLEIFVIIFVGANLGGPIGMVLAIPLYTIIKVSLSELIKGYSQYRVFRN